MPEELPSTSKDSGTNPPKRRRVSWWRIGLGLLLLFGGLKNLNVQGIPAPLLPANEGEWFGYYLAAGAFTIAGLFFLVIGISRVARRPQS
jgi:hypothetical protein